MASQFFEKHKEERNRASHTSISWATGSMSANNGDSRKAPPPPPPPGLLLASRFPVNSLQEVTLKDGSIVSGRVYCTDEMTGSLVLKASLIHTTLASEIRIINVSSIKQSQMLPNKRTTGSSDGSIVDNPTHAPALPLPKIQKKVLEERERKALKLAEESFRQINQKVRCC